VSKKIRSLLLATLTIMLCVVMVAGGTYALYTSETSFVHHLQSGTMTVTLTRTKLTTTALNETSGYLETTTNEQRADFTKSTNANVFGLKDGATIVPMSSYEAVMEISNKSDVAFVYYLELRVPANQGTDANLKLDEQVKVTITIDNKATEATFESGMFIGSQTAPIASVGKTETANFTVKVEFVESSVNNAAMGQEVYFDLIVHAVQAPVKA